MSNIYSMTGFSTAVAQYENSEISCEIRSLNARYLEVYVKLPKILSDLEDAIKELIRRKIGRGKINCVISFNSLNPTLQNLRVDSDTVQLYKKLLEQIRKFADIAEPLQLHHLLEFKDIISFEEDVTIDEALQKTLFQLVELTIEQLNQSRAIEGKHLKEDLEVHLKMIEKLAGEIQVLGKENARIEFQKLYQRLRSMIDENKIDRNRLELELAIISDRVDITEEIVRLRSHLKLFQKNLKQGSPIGKKLNFILQEMHREANTISSKNTLIDISHRIVAIKEEIERIREQVQNIE